jgi:hypothetical protein
MNFITTAPDLKIFNQLVSDQYGLNVLNYGEGHEIITKDQGANFVSIETNKPCSVDDNRELVLFLVRQSSSPTDQVRGGNRNKLSRKTTFKLCGNCKNASGEYNLAVLINQVPGIEYLGSDFSTKQIAQTYFGLEEQDFETFFFTIDFSVLEKIECVKC